MYYLSGSIPKTELEITFDVNEKKFKCCNADGKPIGLLQPKGLSFKELAQNHEDFKKWVKLIPFYSASDF